MKQLAKNYTISGSAVTLTGINVPLSQILLVSDATTGNVLYSIAGPAASNYTQGANSVITLASAPRSSDVLTIYYDDGVTVVNPPTSVSVSNFPASTEISNDVGNPIPVSGTVTVSNQPTSIQVSNFPSTQAVSGTVTANTGLSQPLTDTQLRASAVPVSGTVAISNPQTSVSITGTPSVAISGTVPVSASALPLPNGAAQDGTDATGITAPTGGSGIRGWLSGIYSKLSSALAVTQSGTWSIGRTWTLASGSDSVTATISGTPSVSISGTPSVSATVSNFPSSQSVTNAGTFAVQNTAAVVGGNSVAVKIDGSAVTQPVSGTVAISGTPSITGTVTANAGTNLNTSALALESGGNLATIATNTAKIPSKGSATTANSTPVNIANDQTVPVSLASVPSHPVTNAGTFAVQPSAGDLTSGNQTTKIVNGANTLSVDSTGAILAKTPTGSITMTNSSVGTTSATLLAASSATKLLVVQNTHATQSLYVSTTTPATATNGILIPPLWGYEFPYIPTNALYALGSGASTTYTLWYA